MFKYAQTSFQSAPTKSSINVQHSNFLYCIYLVGKKSVFLNRSSLYFYFIIVSGEDVGMKVAKKKVFLFHDIEWALRRCLV